MNALEIEQEIVRRIGLVKSPEDLKALQKWAKAEKKRNANEPKLQYLTRYYHAATRKVRSGGSGRVIGERITICEYVSFTFLGLEIKISKDNNAGFPISEELFNGKKVYDSYWKEYCSTNYYPKTDIEEYGGINFKERFFETLKEKKYFLITRKKTTYLCNDSCIERKITRGQRLRQHEALDAPKIPKEFLPFFDGCDIEKKDLNYYGPSFNINEYDLPF